MEQNSKKLVAFVCNTPYQIMNCINMLMSNVEGSRENSDLFVVNRFRGAQEIFERIRMQNIFDNVFFVSPKKYNKKLIPRIWTRAIPFRVFDFDDYSFKDKSYSKVFIGDVGEFGLDMRRYNRSAEIYLYDDGMQSYTGNFFLDNYHGKRKYIDKFFKSGLYALEFKKMYVNCPDFCKTTINTTVEKIPTPDEKTVLLLEKVFNFNRLSSNVTDNKIIYLDMRLDEIENYNGISIDKIFDDSIIQSVLVRKHPRSFEKFEKFIVDDNPNMWELECVSNIRDTHVLIGFCSTAQITPKLIGNREPWVIFLYRLMSKSIDEETKKRDYVVERLKEVYCNKERIFVPNTIEEFQQKMKELNNL